MTYVTAMDQRSALRSRSARDHDVGTHQKWVDHAAAEVGTLYVRDGSDDSVKALPCHLRLPSSLQQETFESTCPDPRGSASIPGRNPFPSCASSSQVLVELKSPVLVKVGKSPVLLTAGSLLQRPPSS
jgi:hypothetical protein